MRRVVAEREAMQVVVDADAQVVRAARQSRAQRLAGGDAEPARRRARARDDVVAGLRHAETDRVESRDEVGDARLRHVADDEVLVLRRADVVETVRAHERRQRAKLVGGKMPERHGHRLAWPRGWPRQRLRHLDAPRLELSSTLVRRRVARGQTIRFLVPEAVERFIRRHRLYRPRARR